MELFVLLSLALAAVAFGAVFVAVVQLLRAVRRLRSGVGDVTTRLRPLLDELNAEAAVTSTEVDALRATIAAQQSNRHGQRPY